MFCIKCKKKMKGNFCSECGTALRDTNIDYFRNIKNHKFTDKDKIKLGEYVIEHFNDMLERLANCEWHDDYASDDRHYLWEGLLSKMFGKQFWDYYNGML